MFDKFKGSAGLDLTGMRFVYYWRTDGGHYGLAAKHECQWERSSASVLMIPPVGWDCE